MQSQVQLQTQPRIQTQTQTQMEVQAQTLEEKLNTTTIIYLLLHGQISYTNRIPYFPSLIEITKN